VTDIDGQLSVQAREGHTGRDDVLHPHLAVLSMTSEVPSHREGNGLECRLRIRLYDAIQEMPGKFVTLHLVYLFELGLDNQSAKQRRMEANASNYAGH
jgi:hypothetical protein